MRNYPIFQLTWVGFTKLEFSQENGMLAGISKLLASARKWITLLLEDPLFLQQFHALSFPHCSGQNATEVSEKILFMQFCFLKSRNMINGKWKK